MSSQVLYNLVAMLSFKRFLSFLVFPISPVYIIESLGKLFSRRSICLLLDFNLYIYNDVKFCLELNFMGY